MTPEQRKQELDEMVAFYSEDTSRRSVDDSGQCLYNGPDGRHCAIGRKLHEVIDLGLYEGQSFVDIHSRINRPAINEALKIETRDDVEFWSHIQKFHDTAGYWNEKGLTGAGELKCTRIEMVHCV